MSAALKYQPPRKPSYADDMMPDVVSFDAGQVRMLRDYCLVLFDFMRDARVDLKTAGGIIIPGEAKQPETAAGVWATVVKAGPGYRTSRDVFVANPLREGDRVYLSGQVVGDMLIVDGVEHRIIRGSAEYVLAVES
jgi:co-chaperonin GroES (HSP10)